MLLKVPSNLIAVTCDVCGRPLVEVKIASESTIVHPMVCAYGVPLCLGCADGLGFVVRHTVDIVRGGYVTQTS